MLQTAVRQQSGAKKETSFVRVTRKTGYNLISLHSKKLTDAEAILTSWARLLIWRARICVDASALALPNLTLKPGSSPRATDACTSAQRAPKLKKDPLVRKCYEAGQSNIPSVFKDPSWGDPSPAEDVLIQSFYCKQKGNFENKIGTHPDKAGPSSPLFQGSSAGAMFLDFESVRTMKEDPDEGSASDLSDSERIPIPPSPCTPPELNLRAEEIDPHCFEHLSDTKFKPSDYYYPDFLPPPFSTWDLKGLAVFVNTECTSEPRPQPTGFLEKYVDRLLELEWLQAQTIQAEKGKAAKARPQTAPSALRTLKSPGKNKPLHSPLPSKQLTPHESFPRIPTSHSSHRRDLYSEGNSQLVPSQTHFKAACGSSAHPKRPCEVRSEAKKQPATKQQLPSTQPSQSRSMIQGAGNIRPPKQSSFHDSAAPHKSLTVYTCTDPKKNGNTNNYLPSKKVLSDKKLKANGMKQAPCKFK
ncbi:protein FAM217B isoform X2 [Hemicordylus capensis]|uniref:protein FAM217B isoform X2 n=1 Tax=Hemicordylus capensis TaxID=884348 RepID=UPI0023024EB7|nr:protein FAM217B isoform X2 [Hemicordylus capensis]XP_053102984.1 protein FAM217B isoform X2 [Hemicordylus capensis]XP_053102985.1 protein FAM217B isoform X2 [Hemicordylus capensis]XP_053102986.1 protein FAM217B isoform X2 [Hemicordylus capensis]